MYNIVVVLGLDPRKKIWVCPMPQHSHGASPTPSFSVEVFRDGVQRFRCFGSCALGGDVIDAVGYQRIPGYDPKDGTHVRMALSFLEQGWQPMETAITRAPKPPLDPLLWKKYLPVNERVVKYAETRGLERATLEKFRVGSKGTAMAIPVFEGHILRAVKYRSTSGKPGLRYWSESGSSKALFNYDAVAWTTQPVVIVKAEIPAMLLDQLGILACCETVGEASDMSQWAPLFSFSPKKVYVTDNDRDLDVRRKIWAKAELRAQNLGAELKAPPPQWKDCDEWILADPRAIDVIRSWIF